MGGLKARGLWGGPSALDPMRSKTWGVAPGWYVPRLRRWTRGGSAFRRLSVVAGAHRL